MKSPVRGLYKMRSIARLTGFSPALLRAWESRHGILAPKRAPKGHRLYTEEDLSVLRRVRQLLDAGSSIGEIALSGRRALLEEARSLPPLPREATPVPAAAPGLDVLERLRAAIVASAVAIDAPALEQAIDETFALVSPEVAIHSVLEASARRIGELWREGACSVAGEHLASALFVLRLQRLVEAARPASLAPTAICACFPEELHEVGVLVVAFHLARLGQRVAYLGANLPLLDLERAIVAIEPRTAYVSVTRTELLRDHRAELLAVARRNPRTKIVVGGQGLGSEGPLLEAEGVGVLPTLASAGPTGEILRDRLAAFLSLRTTRPRA